MPPCVHKKSNGLPCQGRAADDGLCSFHRKKATRTQTSGAYSKAVPGVPLKYDGIYQDFLKSEKPFELRHEIALLRMMYVEMRDIIESNREEKIDTLIDAVKDHLDKTINRRPEHEEMIQGLLELIAQTTRLKFKTEFTASLSSIEELREVSDLLMKTVKAAEIMKKIQEGIKIQVQIDTNLLIRIIQQAIYPVVTETDRRARIIQNLAMIAPSAAGGFEQPALPSFGEIPVSRHEPDLGELQALMFTPEDQRQEATPVQLEDWE